MIDIVIPYRFSPVTRDQELRYALRGAVKYFDSINSVHIIGDKPQYLVNVNHIIFKETNWYQELTKNIYSKLMLACASPAVSDPFLYMNDDHFMLKGYQIANIPFYHKGYEWTGKGKYLVTLDSTRQQYPKAPNFDTHVPMLIYKKLFINAMTVLDWRREFGYAIKTSYCAFNNIIGQYLPDYKLDRKPNEYDFEQILTLPVFSVGDHAMNNDMIAFLETLYPVPSKYELHVTS